MPEYEIIIVGAGSAGLTAGLYTVRAGMKVLLLERTTCGGQILLTEVIENFPGFPQGIKGQELAQRLKVQAQDAGLEIVTEEAKEIRKVGNQYIIKTESREYSSYSIILACGAHPKRLGLPGEEKLTGRGVSYCATCDGPLFREREVIVVGGGNAAAEETLYLSKFASQITLVHRRDRLRADKVLQDRLRANPKIDFILNSQVLEIVGEEKVTGVVIKDVHTAKLRDIACQGVFIFAGLKPNTDFARGLVKTDKEGFILTNQDLQTSRRGIFACGDCRLRPLRQIITACGEGASAAVCAGNYVEKLKGTAYI